MVFQYPIAGPDAYAAYPCVAKDDQTERFKTTIKTDNGEKKVVEYVKSSFDDEALAAAGYPWKPNYVAVEGEMRMHYIDVGPKDADEVVLMLHGQPSWSFLYRKMVPVLVEKGYRVVCPDMLGMGKSDKPVDLEQHTYLKHVERVKAFIAGVFPEALVDGNGPTINLFVQDWGSLIGLRVAADESKWFKRIVSANGNLPVFPSTMGVGFNPLSAPDVVNYNCSDQRTFAELTKERQSSAPCGAFGADKSCFSKWINYALTSPTLLPSAVLQVAMSTDINSTELEFYDRPFPTKTHAAAIRAFPSMIAAVREPQFGNAAAWESLKAFPRPYLALAGEDDPGLGSVETQSRLYKSIAGAKMHDFEHRRYPNAGHFIQEDAGEEIAAYVADFIAGTKDLVASNAQSTSPGMTPTTAPLNALGMFVLLACLLARWKSKQRKTEKLL